MIKLLHLVLSIGCTIAAFCVLDSRTAFAVALWYVGKQLCDSYHKP